MFWENGYPPQMRREEIENFERNTKFKNIKLSLVLCLFSNSTQSNHFENIFSKSIPFFRFQCTRPPGERFSNFVMIRDAITVTMIMRKWTSKIDMKITVWRPHSRRLRFSIFGKQCRSFLTPHKSQLVDPICLLLSPFLNSFEVLKARGPPESDFPICSIIRNL